MDDKKQQLKMNPSTASHRLRKKLLFKFIKELNKDNCYQCGKKIKDISKFSVDHKIPWLHSENPIELFFDLDNIAFSHLECNSRAARDGRYKLVKHPSYSAYINRKCRCKECIEIYNQKRKLYTSKKINQK